MPSLVVQLPNLVAMGPMLPVQLALSPDAEDALRRAGAPVPAPLAINAIVDTGATRTVIAAGLAQKLGLQPVGAASTHTASAANVPCDEYLVRLALQSLTVVSIKVIELPLTMQRIQCLIGRDLLARAVMVYTGLTNTFSLSF